MTGALLLKRVITLLFLLLVCSGCGVGSFEHDNLNMKEAWMQMADAMREENRGPFLNEKTENEQYLKETYQLSLAANDYALLSAIHSDIVSEAAIFHCSDKNRSIIIEKAQQRCQRARQEGYDAYLVTRGNYCCVFIGEQAQWMRAYVEGL